MSAGIPRIDFTHNFTKEIGGKHMFGVTRRRLGVILSVLTMTLVLILILATTSSAQGKGPIVHRVHVGVPDACTAFGLPPGCDANWSLVAVQYADGSVSGQFTDRFASPYGGFHAVIDCLYVDGNDAWISGVITHGNGVGEPVSARVRDNGTSANDPADQISFSHIGADGGDHPHGTCDQQPDYEQLDVPQGQVVVE